MSRKSTSLCSDERVMCIGIDVHRKNWRIDVRHDGVSLRKMSVDPSPGVLAKTVRDLFPSARFRSVYEAGFSGYWAHRELQRLGIENMVVNPADVPTTSKEKDRKDDPIDCGKLSRELNNGSLHGIFVPTPEQEGLRAMSRLLDQQRCSTTRVKNRVKAHLHFTGASVPSHDEVSHWSRAFITCLQELELPTEHHKATLDMHLDELQWLRKRRLDLLRKLRILSQDIEDISLLRTVPGIGFITAITLYAELMNMDRFRNNDHLASFVGLVPSTATSSDKTTTRGMTHRHAKYLRYLLIEASWHAIRKDEVLAMSFVELTKRMSKGEAIVRIAKKLLRRIRCVLKDRKPYCTGMLE